MITKQIVVLGVVLASSAVPWLNAAGSGAESGVTSKAKHTASRPRLVLLASGLEGASGSALGPGGALYVTEGAAGRISQVDPQSGAVTTFATGLPTQVIPLGGAIDLAFIGRTAYALVTLVGPDVGGADVVGIYRVDSPHIATAIADIGQFAILHPPATPFDVPSGLQYALEPYRGGFLVSDGHHNRVLRVTLDGAISEFRSFDNIVPTGLALAGNTVYMAEAGPVPHVPESGKVVSFGAKSTEVTEVASGARLLVDIEFGRGRALYALSQGRFPAGGNPADPALPDTGALLRVNEDGTFTVVVDRLNQPTSLEIIGETAFVVTLGGEVWRIDGVAQRD